MTPAPADSGSVSEPLSNDSLKGLYLDEALGRAEAIVAALTVGSAPTDEDVDWALLAAHSLKGLTAQAGDLALADRVHAIEDALTTLRTLDTTQRAADTATLVDQLQTVTNALTAGVGPNVSRDVALEEIGEAAAGEVRRVAERRAITVTVELVVPSGIRVPRRIAGVMVDALGHVLRNAVTHGSPRGGAIHIAFTRSADILTVVVGDRGNAESRAAERTPDLESGRGIGLQAAHSRLTAIGGELSLSPAPWGGTSVTIRVPF